LAAIRILADNSRNKVPVEEERRIPQITKGASTIALIVGVIGALVAVFVAYRASEEQDSWWQTSMWILAGAIIFLTLIVVVQSFIRANEILIMDAQGIRLEKAATIKCQLAWSQFGGFESIEPRVHVGIVAPFRVAILDRAGNSVMRVALCNMLSSSSKYECARNAALLAEHVPPGGTKPQAASPIRPATWLRPALLLLAVICVLITWLADYSIARLILRAFHAHAEYLADTIPYTLQFLSAACLCWILMMLWAAVPAEIPPPTRGPSLDEFLIANAGRPQPVDLQTGKRYEYVHPGALISKAQRQIDKMLVTLPGFLCVVVLVIGLLLVDMRIHPREDFWQKISVLTFYVLIGVFFTDSLTTQMRRLNILCDSAYDEISVSEDKLSVRRGDEVREFSRQPVASRGRKWPSQFGGYRTTIGEKGNRYLVDLRYLREV